jgi:hypothetical protein
MYRLDETALLNVGALVFAVRSSLHGAHLMTRGLEDLTCHLRPHSLSVCSGVARGLSGGGCCDIKKFIRRLTRQCAVRPENVEGQGRSII